MRSFHGLPGQAPGWALLGAAALVAPGGIAAAADLPAKAAAPVAYVQICDAYGAGFFTIPGTDTCLRIGGQVRAEYSFRGNAPTDQPKQAATNLAGTVYNRDASAFRGRGYLNADARTATSYGVLRSYLQLRATTDTTGPGPFGGASLSKTTPPTKTGLFQGLGNSYISLDKGFIQFAGITVGRAQSFFDFDAQSRELLANSMANSNQLTELFAYTAPLGNGVSVSLSVEDRNERAIGDNGAGVSALTFTGKATDKSTYLAYNGETVPDIVGSLKADQEWGSAQISGAYHQLSSQTVTVNGAAVNPANVAAFAALAGLTLKLPQIAKGDSVTIQGTYERGAMDYINSIDYFNGPTNVYSHKFVMSIPVNDAFVSPDGKITPNRGWGLYGAFTHVWAPQWTSSLFGDYVQIKNPTQAQTLSASADNARITQIGGNLIWSPVKDFLIGGEVLYTKMKLTGANTLSSGTQPAEPDDIRARLSLRRTF